MQFFENDENSENEKKISTQVWGEGDSSAVPFPGAHEQGLRFSTSPCRLQMFDKYGKGKDGFGCHEETNPDRRR